MASRDPECNVHSPVDDVAGPAYRVARRIPFRAGAAMIFANWLTESLFPFLLAILPGGLWMAFWLWAVDWKKVWPVLAEGAWAPCVLLILIAALVWSRIAPGSCSCLGFVTLPNFWWQLGSVSALAACALFSGWLQGVIHYEPVQVAVEPPAHHEQGNGHGHDHAHEPHHAADHGHGHGHH